MTPTDRRRFSVQPVEGVHGELIESPDYVSGRPTRLVQTSSVADRLWIDQHHHLTPEEAKELGERLIRWAETGSLLFEGEEKHVAEASR